MGLLADAWVRLTLGKVGYAALQATLLWPCLRLVDAHPGVAIVFGAGPAPQTGYVEVWGNGVNLG